MNPATPNGRNDFRPPPRTRRCIVARLLGGYRADGLEGSPFGSGTGDSWSAAPCSGPGAHVGKEQTGADLGGEFHKVLVTPRRGDAAKQCRLPAQPRAVAVGNLHVRRVPAALLDQ
jgi:hypothetical protein